MIWKTALCSLLFITGACSGVEDKPPASTTWSEADYIKPIPGKSDTIPEAEADRGEVLIAYSDCYSCHTVDKRFKGPAFRDIAKRYPVNDGYIETLAQRIIVGGSGAWGYSVMSPHTDLSPEHAKTMVRYILSLKE